MVDAMCMSTACFARAPQRCASRLIEHFLLTCQEVTAFRKTRNQLDRIYLLGNMCNTHQGAHIILETSAQLLWKTEATLWTKSNNSNSPRRAGRSPHS